MQVVPSPRMQGQEAVQGPQSRVPGRRPLPAAAPWTPETLSPQHNAPPPFVQLPQPQFMQHHQSWVPNGEALWHSLPVHK